MVTCLKTKKENTQASRKFLQDNKWANKEYVMGKSGKYVLLAITDDADQKAILAEITGTIETRNLQKLKKPVTNLKDALSKVIPSDQLDHINRGFETVGDIAVIEIPDDVAKLELNIAWALKRIHKNINVVVKKSEKTSGTYRIRKVKVLCGEKRTEAIHKESGARLKLDLNKAYFSPKMGSERLRILKLIKPNENILHMFAGIGPYPIVFARNRKDITQTAIELNPSAAKFFKENLKLNKLEKRIKFIKGDAKIEVPKLKQTFDRIIMVLPSDAHKFLQQALEVAKHNAIIHLYQFEHEKDAAKHAQILKQLIEKLGGKVKSIDIVRSGYFAPKINRYCFDIQLA